MAKSSKRTQPTIAEEVAKRLRTQKVQAMVQTQSEITPLPRERETEFREWLKKNDVTDLDAPESHYDYRGAFLAGVSRSATGKWPDTFKQHGHPTFSVESQYSKGPNDGGRFVGERFIPPNEPSAQTATRTPILDVLASREARPPSAMLDAFSSQDTVPESRTPLLNALAPRAMSFAESAQAVQQRPTQHIAIFPAERQGPFDDLVIGAAQSLKDAFVGGVNFVLGSTSAAQPIVSDEEAVAARAQGRIVQTEREIRQHQQAAALVGSSLVGGAATTTILKGLVPLARTALGGTTAGAAFGALRERGEGESLLGAIVFDAAIFGGLSLAGGLVGRATRPVRVGVDQLEAAGVRVGAAATKGREYGKAIFEEAQGISDVLSAEALESVPQQTLANLDVIVQSHPANIGILRRFLGSPSKWRDIGGPVGDAAARLTNNAQRRMGLALRLQAEWDATLKEAEKLTTEGARGPFQGVVRQTRKEQLGKLLDTVFETAELPLTLPPNLARAFGLLRDRLLADREALKLLVGGTADWGIDAYLPHVFAGRWALTNAQTGEVMRLAGIGEVRRAAAELVAQQPGLALRIAPKEFLIPGEMAGLGLTGNQLGRFIGQASRALSIDRDEIASVLFEGRIARVKPAKRFFGHAMERGDVPLAGWESDPFQALRIYAAGAARKIAFHDFEQKATSIIEALGRVEGTRASSSALKVYVDRVLGRPSELEVATRATLQEIARRTTSRLPPGMQDFAERIVDPRVFLGKVAAWEAMARLGYSPTAWFVNMSQTLVNTSSAIGWGPTMRGLRLLMDKTQRPQVEAVLRALDIDLAVPLSAADQLVTRQLGQVSPFHPLYLFNKIETANRSIAALSMYQEQLARGADIRVAMEAARRFVRETQFDYSLADAPRLLQGPLGTGVFQFKKFLIKELEFLWGLRRNPAALARFAINIQAIGGVGAIMALPPLLLLDWLTGEVTGERLSERIQREWPRASRGLPGLAGVDVSGNVAIGLPRDAGDLVGPGMSDLVVIARDVLGKQAVDLIRQKEGHLTPQERAQIAAQLAPVMARRLWDAYEILERDAVRVRGSHDLKFQIENAEKEALLTAFGVRSLERAEEQRVWTTQQRMVALHRKDEEAVVQEMVNAYLDGDATRFTQVRTDAQEAGLVIMPEQFRSALRNALIQRTARGALRAPPEMREGLLQRLPEGALPR